jgi:hypothetical protein
MAFFKSEQNYGDEWNEAIEIIVEYGSPEQWVELCFAANKLSGTHQDSANRFEAKLRELDPAPLSLLLPRLHKAIDNAPKLAEMTLSILGSNPANLSEENLASLVETTNNLRQEWLDRDARIKAGASGVKLDSLSTLWCKLLWLWGRASGGQEILLSTLQCPGLSKVIYRETLFALENMVQAQEQALTLDEGIFNSPAMNYSDLSSVLTRIAVNAGLSVPTKQPQVSLSMADWDVLRESESQSASAQVVRAVSEGDVFALNALIAKKTTNPFVNYWGS